jgi:hypothetical protein
MRYWELTNKERAELKEGEFDRYVKLECAHAGIEIPEKPILVDVPELPIINYQFAPAARLSWSRFLVFGSETNRNTFLKLGADYVETYDEKKPITLNQERYEQAATSLKVVDSREKAEYDRIETIRIKIQEENDAKLKKYDTAREAHLGIVNQIDSDLSRVRLEMSEFSRVVRRYEEYLELANDDQAIAFKFLDKLFDPKLIKTALDVENSEWTFLKPKPESIELEV